MTSYSPVLILQVTLWCLISWCNYPVQCGLFTFQFPFPLYTELPTLHTMKSRCLTAQCSLCLVFIVGTLIPKFLVMSSLTGSICVLYHLSFASGATPDKLLVASIATFSHLFFQAQPGSMLLDSNQANLGLPA